MGKVEKYIHLLYEDTEEDFEEEEIFDEHEYIPCSTYRDYCPSNPWDAPGMSVKDFI